jgi:hypothetical protein
MMNGNAAQSVNIEEEPANEFYANLFRKDRRCKKSLREGNNATIATTSTPNQSQSPVVSASASYIPPEQQPIKTNVSQFGKVYQRAFTNPPPLSKISLTKNNKGHKLLTQMGWKEEEGGLGRCRQGTLTPIRTVWKRDSKGLGVVKAKARVTHIPSFSKAKVRTETKAERKRRKRLEAEKESLKQKSVRVLLNSDLPPEYDDFLG